MSNVELKIVRPPFMPLDSLMVKSVRIKSYIRLTTNFGTQLPK
jgi:hypothetical protein